MIKREVFNSSIGTPYEFAYPRFSSQQEEEILAKLFEQLLIFDRVIIRTNRLNFSLVFLLSKLGINTVERLLERGYIKFLIWTPMIVTGSGKQMDDGTIDESVMLGRPPIMAGSLANDDIDPEENVRQALSRFELNRDRKRAFSREAVKNYIVPDGMEFASESSRFIIDAYVNNNLCNLGLPFEKDPNQLDLEQRRKLLSLGHTVIETAILAQYGLKSFENYEHFAICSQNLANIGKAYNVTKNASTLFKLEDLPNLSELYTQERIDFERIFDFRNLPAAKFYRKWINEVGENASGKEITKEYLNQIKGNTRFFTTRGGKLVKRLMLFGVSTAIGKAVGADVGTATGLALGVLDNLWLDGILKGKNPAMYIDSIKKEIMQDKSLVK